MIRIGRAGAAGSVTPAELSRLRSRFARRNFLRLAGFVEPDLLALIQQKLRRDEFRDSRDKDGIEIRQTPRDPAAGLFLGMLFSDRRLFAFLEAVTGDRSIGSLTGGIFRMVPGASHHVGWHKDLAPGGRRAAGMTVNLGPKPIQGGLLQFRAAPDRRRIGEVRYKRAGDAVLFRLREDLEHRSTDVEGSEPKTIYACWFQRKRAGVGRRVRREERG